MTWALKRQARGFDSGQPRSRFRPVHAGRLDAAVLLGAALVVGLVVAVQLA